MEMNSPIRILNLFTILNRGGAETMVMNYYRHIDRSKIQFDFLVHREEEGEYEAEIRSMGGRIYRMPPVRPWTANRYKKQMKQFLVDHPEYRVLHSHMSELGCYALEVAKELSIPVRIAHAHNRPHGIDIKTPIRWYYKKKMAPYLTDRFICGYEAGVWLFGKEMSSQFYMLNNAVDAKLFTYNETTRSEIRNELGLSDDFVIGHVGRFNVQKNHSYIIEVFSEIVKMIPNAKLILVGDGELKNEIQKKVCMMQLENSVIFLGVRKDIPRLLQAFDIFLFPSLFEGLSVAIIEAQAAGLPCVISESVPIECKKTELVFAYNRTDGAKEWAEKIADMRSIPRSNTYGEICLAGFDIEENAKKLQEFYLKRLGEQG